MAQRLSHRYASRIAQIPPLLPIHPERAPPLSDNDFSTLSPRHGHGYDSPAHLNGTESWEAVRRYHDSAEEAAHEFERSVLGEVSDLPRHRPKSKAKDKRHVSRPVSDADSEMEAVIGPAAKRRKLEKMFPTPDQDAGNVDRLPPPRPSVVSKAKGKGKQIVREPSHDSISLTPKSARKKQGGKKKLDLGIENISHPPSTAGDITPGVSRAVSPTPAVSALVHELDVAVPPLKRAKKIDDAAMLKRVKNLEDSQRKVWTGIAKKDVAKASIHTFLPRFPADVNWISRHTRFIRWVFKPI